MKKLSLLFTFILSFGLQAQNLVPNPSFEEYNSLEVTNAGSTHFAPPWFSSPYSPYLPNVGTGSADYYNTLMDFSNTNVTDYEMQAPRTGNAFMGFINTYDPAVGGGGEIEDSMAFDISMNESIQIQLNEPMLVGKYYDVSFYVATLKNTYLYNNTNMVTDELGVYFHTDSIYTLTHVSDLNGPAGSVENVVRLLESIYNGPWDYTNYLVEFLVEPDLELNQLLTDPEEWVQVDTLFYADKPYEFMYFGMFNWYDQMSSYYPLECCGEDISYVVIDDVSVSLHESVKETAGTGNDTTLCIGESMILESHNLNNYIYHWADSLGNEWDIPNPTVSPDTTTTYYLSVKDFAFNETFDSITVTIDECNENIADIYASQIKVFPNPATTIVQIESIYTIDSWKLRDAVGREVKSSKLKIENTSSLDVRSLDAGLYFLEMEIDGIRVVKQLLIE